MLEINKLTRLDIGVTKENKARNLYIDMNAWYTDHPNATFTIWHKRNGDETKYPASGVSFNRDTGILKWTPDAVDTYYVGKGIAEFRMTEDDVIKKTKDVITDTEKSWELPSGEELPSGWQNFLNQVESDKNIVMQAVGQIGDNVELAEAWATGKKDGTDVPSTDPAYHNNAKYYSDLAGSAKTAAETAQGKAEEAQGKAEEAQGKAEDASGTYPYISQTTGNWMVYDADEGQFVDTGVHAKGDKGDPGQSGSGVPAGGTPDQILTKRTSADGDAIWKDPQDISGKADKDTDAVEGNFAAFDANGNPVDSGHKHGDYLTSHQDISGKADKDTDAVEGNFAAFDANGNPVDSGHKHGDYLTQHQDISGKADKDTDAVTGNFAAFDANGNPVDSGHKHGDYLTEHQDISGKLDKANVYYGLDKTTDGYALDARSGYVLQTNISNIRKTTGYQAVLHNGNWQLPSGTDAAIGEYIWLNGELGRATAAITGGSTNIISGTNWSKETSGALNTITSEKADKDTDAVTGNFAAFDASGNPVDSGNKASDFLTAHQDISGKADKSAIAWIETGNSASRTYAEGTYIYWGGNLCVAAEDITSGNPLTPLNLQPVTTKGLANELLDGIETNAGGISSNAGNIAKLKSNLGIVEDGNTAANAISAGQYVIWKGDLYTADAAIAAGETLASSGGSKNLTACSGGGLNSLNSKITLHDVLWTGDAHAVSDYIQLAHPKSDYKSLLFVFNVIPSRTPNFDVPADGLWYPEIQTYGYWNVCCSGCQVPDLTLYWDTDSQCHITAYHKASSMTEYNPGIVKVIGFKS